VLEHFEAWQNNGRSPPVGDPAASGVRVSGEQLAERSEQQDWDTSKSE
jgi:hypothetical protein